MNKRVITVIVFWHVIIIVMLLACNKSEDNHVYNEELIFTHAYKIDIDPYNYRDTVNQKMYRIKDDISSNIPDTLNSMPVFKWENVSSDLYTIVLSQSPIQVSNGEVNANDFIWQWHSGMNNEIIEDLNEKEYLIVKYIQGKPVLNKKILYDTQPFPLESGLYYWAVWAWNNAGSQVLFSSKLRMFIVE